MSFFDANTLTWDGELAGGECVSLGLSGNETGGIGDEVTSTVSIVSATQVNDTVNSDTNPGNEQVTPAPYTIVGLPDIKAESYIVTTGSIAAVTEVECQIDVSNTGAGTYFDNDFNIFAFTLPEGASFTGVTDLDPSDGIDADNDNCFPAGVLGDTINLPGLGSYTGRTVIVCQLGIVGGSIPIGDTVYPFRIKVVAGVAMAAGTADVFGIFEGNDPGTFELFSAIATGQNLEETIENNPNDNIFRLTYDPSSLQATVARCAGQGAIATDCAGCFTITFNKKIVASSFGDDDVNLGGNGTVDSLTQLDDTTWELRVKNITPGATLEFLLCLNQIQDYSAQQNSTQVLGINTIRYEVAGTSDANSASGTLAATGSNGTTSLFAAGLLLVGLAMAFASRKKVSVEI